MAVGLDGPLHHQQSGKEMNEDSSHPRRHEMGLRRSKVNIQNHNSDTYAEKKTIRLITDNCIKSNKELKCKVLRSTLALNL